MTRHSVSPDRLVNNRLRLSLVCATGVVLLASVLSRATSLSIAQSDVQLPPIPTVEFGITDRELLESVYQFAAHNREIVDHVPCFCGCERSHDHTAVSSCFLSSPPGRVPVTWNDHGAKCVICTNVVREAMEQWESGKSIDELRSSIIAKYRTDGMPMTPTPKPSPELGRKRIVQKPPL
jgi:hypothetical protein